MYSIPSKLLPGRTFIRNTLRTLQLRHLASTPETNNKKHDKINRSYGTSAGAEPFINGTSSSYVEEMYDSWKSDPQSVHKVSPIGLLKDTAND